MTDVIFDRLVSSGVYFDRLEYVDTTPFIEDITGAQDGAPLTVTGVGFDASDNTLWAGVPDDESNTPIQIPIDTEGTTEIVSENLDASAFYLTQPTTFFVRNSSGVASNVFAVVIAPATGEKVVAIQQEFLGAGASRIESISELEFGNEIRVRNVVGGTIADINLTQQGAFDVDEAVTSFDAAAFDGELGPWGTITLEDPISTASVPSVLGLTLAAATGAIQSAGLVVKALPDIPSADFPAGQVAVQFPAATASVSIGSTVEITLSLGSGVVLVPTLIGFPQAEAEAALTALGLVPRAYVRIDGNNTGTVVNQTIAPQTVVVVGSEVGLAISSNQMPNLVGQLLQNATGVIETAGLVLANVTERFELGAPSGTVLSQDPEADSEVTPSAAVRLVVSASGEPRFTPSITPYRTRKRPYNPSV